MVTPEPHKHFWSVWLLKNRTTHYRYCMVQYCGETEEKEAPKA